LARILLNKENLFYNLSVISEQTKSKNKVAIVLKDNAYGHGILEIATISK
jgi:alanine racemase